MTDAPKRIAFRKKYMSDAITNGLLMDDPNYIHYIRADLSDALVRAALEAACDEMEDYGWYAAKRIIYEKMYSDPEAIAAIVASVTEGV